jgi:hypothetical protein
MQNAPNITNNVNWIISLQCSNIMSLLELSDESSVLNTCLYPVVYYNCVIIIVFISMNTANHLYTV